MTNCKKKVLILQLIIIIIKYIIWSVKQKEKAGESLFF